MIYLPGNRSKYKVSRSSHMPDHLSFLTSTERTVRPLKGSTMSSNWRSSTKEYRNRILGLNKEQGLGWIYTRLVSRSCQRCSNSLLTEWREGLFVSQRAEITSGLSTDYDTRSIDQHTHLDTRPQNHLRSSEQQSLLPSDFLILILVNVWNVRRFVIWSHGGFGISESTKYFSFSSSASWF